MYIGLSEGWVERVEEAAPDCVLLTVRLGCVAWRGRTGPGTSDAAPAKAIAYPSLLAVVPSVGHRVLLNTTAVDLGLGSGGYHFVIAVSPEVDKPVRQARDTELGQAAGDPGDAGPRGVAEEVVPRPSGHIMKLRYTPFQFACLAAEEAGGAAHEGLGEFAGLGGTPVVCCELHSQVPAVAAGAAQITGGRARVTYVMTDGGALPAAFSRLTREMRAAGLVHRVITCGQAFGGDLEAINIYSALASARILGDSDVIITGMGPGLAGTGTPLGFSGVEQGQALNAAASLGGLPVAVPRLSFADPRGRHYGVSHHTSSVLGKVCLAPCVLAMPRLPEEAANVIYSDGTDSERLAVRGHLTLVEEGSPGLEYLAQVGIRPTAMGRGVREDPEFFLAASAAGRVAGKLSKVLSGLPAPAGVHALSRKAKPGTAGSIR